MGDSAAEDRTWATLQKHMSDSSHDIGEIRTAVERISATLAAQGATVNLLKTIIFSALGAAIAVSVGAVAQLVIHK